MKELDTMIRDTKRELEDLESRIDHATEYAKKIGYVEEMTQRLLNVRSQLRLLEGAKKLIVKAEALNMI